MHSLGPLGHRDRRRLAVVGDDLTVATDAGVYLRRNGRDCVLLANGRCTLHDEASPERKPQLCRRFPFGLVATPSGGRVTTSHRCPCRTLGARPLLDPTQVIRALGGDGYNLRPDGRVPEALRWTRRTTMSFAHFENAESRVLERLAKGEATHAAIGREPELPSIEGGWPSVAQQIGALAGAGRGILLTALRWFSCALSAVAERRPVELPQADDHLERPWAHAFDAAEVDERLPALLIADWAHDVLWGLGWIALGSFEVGRTELGVRATIADAIVAASERRGAHPLRAAAEAVMIVELVAMLPPWQEAVRRLERA